MKNIALAAVLVAAFGPAVASASETPVWSGYYVGIHGGYDWLDTDIGNYNFYDQDYEGMSGGIQAGLDHQLPNDLVVGLSMDLGMSDTSGRRTSVANIGGFPFVTNARVETDAYGALRGRLGYALGDFLPYATLGIAWAQHKVSYTQTFLGATVTNLQQKKSHLGWLAGAGVEYAFAESLSLKVEYIYADYGSEVYSGTSVGIPTDGTVGLTSHSTRLGLNFRF